MNQPRSNILTLAALTAAVVLVAILGVQKQSLRLKYNALIEESSGPYAGLSMPSFDAITLSGDSVTIGSESDGSNQVLFFFAAACRTSRGTIPAWNEIAQHATAEDRFSVYGIQLDSATMRIAYPDADEPRFPVLRLPDPRLQEWYRIRGVPATVVLNASGRVAYRKLGGLTRQATIDSVLTAAAESELTLALAGNTPNGNDVPGR